MLKDSVSYKKRPVLVFSWHTEILKHMEGICGLTQAILDAELEPGLWL